MFLSEPAKPWMPNCCSIVSCSLCFFSWRISSLTVIFSLRAKSSTAGSKDRRVVLVLGDYISLLTRCVILRSFLSQTPGLDSGMKKLFHSNITVKQSPLCLGPWLTNILFLKSRLQTPSNCKVFPSDSDCPFSPGFRIRRRLDPKPSSLFRFSCSCIGVLELTLLYWDTFQKILTVWTAEVIYLAEILWEVQYCAKDLDQCERVL